MLVWLVDWLVGWLAGVVGERLMSMPNITSRSDDDGDDDVHSLYIEATADRHGTHKLSPSSDLSLSPVFKQWAGMRGRLCGDNIDGGGQV